MNVQFQEFAKYSKDNDSNGRECLWKGRVLRLDFFEMSRLAQKHLWQVGCPPFGVFATEKNAYVLGNELIF